MATRLDLVIAATALAGGLLLVEGSHRTEIELPKRVAAPDVCAEADWSYAVGRMVFFDGGFVTGMDHRRMTARFAVPPECTR